MPVTRVRPVNTTPISAEARGDAVPGHRPGASARGSSTEPTDGDEEGQVGEPGRRARGCRGGARRRPGPRPAGDSTRPNSTQPGDADRARAMPEDPRCPWRAPVVVDRSVLMRPPGAARRPSSPSCAVGEGEHAEETDPGPAFRCGRAAGAERRFVRSCRTDQHRGHHREQQQREQRLPDPEPGGEDADRAYPWPPGRRSSRRTVDDEQGHALPAQVGVVEQHHARRRGATSRTSSCAARAPALPRKMPAGSSPDSRRPSRPPSAASMAKDRWTASTSENSTATQNRPGVAACERAPVGIEGEGEQQQHEQGERAAPGSWPTRLRASMRRSLPATSAAALSIRHPPVRWLARTPARAVGPARPADGGATSGRLDGAAGQHDRPVGQGARLRSSSWDASTTVAPAGDGLAHEVVEQVAAVGVEPGVGLVEQPQLGAAGDERRRPPSAGAGRPRAGRRRCGPGARRGRGWSRAVAISAVRGARACGPRTGRSRRRSGRRRGGSACPSRPTWRRTARRSDRRSWPSTTASPEATATSPAQTRSSVVLPAPFGPRTSTISPRSTSRSRRPAPGSARGAPRLLEGGPPAPWVAANSTGRGGPTPRGSSAATARRRADLGERSRRERRRPSSPSRRRAAGTVDQMRGWRWWVGRLGRVLIVLGVLVLLFAAYQLWGTGIQEARAQDDLSREFNQTMAATTAPTTVPTTAAPTTAAPATTVAPPTTAAPSTAPPAAGRGRRPGPPRDPQDRRRQDRRRGRRRRRPAQGTGPLPRHRAARRGAATSPSPATAPPTARRSGTSTS